MYNFAAKCPILHIKFPKLFGGVIHRCEKGRPPPAPIPALRGGPSAPDRHHPNLIPHFQIYLLRSMLTGHMKLLREN